MKYSSKELRIIESKITHLLTVIQQQNLDHFSKLQLRAILLKHKFIQKYYVDVVRLAIVDTVEFIGKEKFPVYAAEPENNDLMEYLMPYILFFIEENYTYMQKNCLLNNITMIEAFQTVGKQRLAIFISNSVNGLYNETIVKTSGQANIQYFRFVATIDNRTSNICRSMNDKIITSNQGYFYPPLHRNCRSRLQPMTDKFNEKQIFNGKLTSRDVRIVSWYKGTYACNFENLNIDNMLMAYL